MPREETSKELAKIAKKLGVEVETHYGDGDRVNKVRFDLTPATWADLANKEGKLLPVCCANVSAIRDEMIDAMREDGWMRADEMQKVVANMSGHEYPDGHPVAKVAAAWRALEGKIELGRQATADLSEPSDVATCANYSKVLRFCSEFAFNHICSNWGEDDHDRAAHNAALCELIPIVKALGESIHRSGFPPVEGYAIVRQSTRHIYGMLRGLAVFPTLAEAEEVMARWLKTGQVKPKVAEVRAARVSWEHGIELLDRLPVPGTKLAPEATPEEVRDAKEALAKMLKATKNDRIEAILNRAFDEVDKVRAEGIAL